VKANADFSEYLELAKAFKYREMGENTKAFWMLRKLVVLGSEVNPYYNNAFGVWLMEIGQYREAARYFGLAFAQGNAEALLNQAIALSELPSERGEAIAHWQKVLALGKPELVPIAHDLLRILHPDSLSRLDMAKLGWLNQQYLKSDDPAAVAKHLEWHLQHAGLDLANGPSPTDVVIAMRDRVQTLKDMAERAAVWYRPLTVYDDAAVAKHLKPEAAAALADARDRFAKLDTWSAESVSSALHATAEALGLGIGKVAQPMRVAITGTQISPDISHTVYLAGQGEAVRRIDAALAMIPA
jgi:tetratricopeptide (TPR) repeat protein